MLKRFLSYFVPINIYEQKSVLSKSLEVTWSNGMLVLDSKNTNYSYGSLQRILRKGLLHIGHDAIRKMNHILVLGVAGGSVIHTLIDEFKYTGKITGVEIDPGVIDIANRYFGLDKLANLSIIIDDAFEFILKTSDTYDLIIVDIFADVEMPNFLFEPFFVNRLHFLLNKKGYVLFNTMTLTRLHDKRNDKYVQNVDTNYFKVTRLDRVAQHNEVIILEKLN